MQVHPNGRILLRFDRNANEPDAFRQQLSACVLDRQGNLWLGTDELTGLSRLKRTAPGIFGKHDYTELANRLRLPERDEEIDIEGMDIARDGDRDQLWIIGSHTSTRKGIKPEVGDAENLGRLRDVRVRRNRFLIARTEIKNGKVEPGGIVQLPISDKGNALSRALRDDPHLGPFLCAKDKKKKKKKRGCVQTASKENGFDIEGAAIRGRRLFMGLRGPVLRGLAMLIEVQLRESGHGGLALDEVGIADRHYRKHFLQLNGMGVRDLVWHEDDLLILAGPTMNITGLQSIYRFHDAADLADDSISELDGVRLELLYHLPLVTEGDKAEGICLYDSLGEPGLLVVYDAPRPGRLVAKDAVLGDVFALPQA